MGMPQSHRWLLHSPNIPSLPLCPQRGGDAKRWPPPPTGTGATFPPSPATTLQLGSSPGGFLLPRSRRRSAPKSHHGTRGAEPPRPREGSTGRCPLPPPAAPHDHRDPIASTRLQQPDLGCSPRPATRRVAPCPGTVPPAPKTRGSPRLWDAGAAPGWLASPWGACRGMGRWDQSPEPAPHPKKGTSMGTRGTGLTSERPVPLLPLYQGCTQG